MKKKTNRLESIYKRLKREMKEQTIEDLFISNKPRKIRYNPNYQRHYIWNITKAVNLIETILINGEIPPITVVKSDDEIEIIDRKTKI